MLIDTPLVRSVRDHLLELSRGNLPDDALSEEAAPGSPEERALLERFYPFAELLFLVAQSDGVIDEAEREVALGAFHALTAGRLCAQTLSSLRDELEGRLDRDGLEARLEAVCNHLARDREDAELGFTLASAIAVADDRVDSNESLLINNLASWLGISQRRIRVLVDSGAKSEPPPPRSP